MERIKHEQLISHGLNQLNNFEDFVYIFNSYGTNFISEIKSMGFKETYSCSKGRDFELSEHTFRKISQAEKDAENLQLQIKKLESKFNIKITYTKNEH